MTPARVRSAKLQDFRATGIIWVQLSTPPTMQPSKLINPNENETMKARLGRCYELSGMLVLHNPGPGITLVHGSIQGMGKPRIEHAWVELADGSVWDLNSALLDVLGESEQVLPDHPLRDPNG